MIKVLIVYHQVKPGVDCPDGYASAWVTTQMWKKASFATTIDIIGATYDGEVVDIDGYDAVQLVDFSYPVEVLNQWAEDYPDTAISVIDHHKTAQDALNKVSDKIRTHFDMDECGATLAWKKFNPDVPIPAFLEYVRDRDLWQKKLPYTEEIHEAIGFIGRTFALYDMIEHLTQDQLIQVFAPLGERLLKPKREKVEEIAKGYKLVEFMGYAPVALVHVPEENERLTSDIGQWVYDHIDVAFVVMAMGHEDKGKMSLSFRSKLGEGADVGEIARKLDGGGHKHASGAVILESRLRELLESADEEY